LLFVVFAVTAIVWSLSVIRWSVSRSRAARRPLIVTSAAAMIAAAAMLASDARAFAHLHAVSPPRLSIRATGHGDWWELAYSRGGVAFTTANEMHLPAGSVVNVEWRGATKQPWISGIDTYGDGALITAKPRVTTARFVALHPLSNETMPVIVDDTPAFETWFAREAARAQPSTAGAALFTNAGCAYCHRIRGAAESPSQVAPDLTHFASRKLIGGVAAKKPGVLAGWIAASRGIKPSSRMPDNAIAPEVLFRLVAYLESLR
jgi:cytochrome c oxidase subunit 2